MEQYLTEIFERLKAEQKEKALAICPRCGKPKMRPVPAHNSFSRHVDIYICPDCGTDEAFRDFHREPMRLTRWHAVCEEMKGKTFLDFLRGKKELECELIIGNSDMPATFVWDEESNITPYGEEYYAPILDAPYKVLDNGNIEVFCDSYKLGEHFVLALAGYIGEKEWERLFGTVGEGD